MQGSKTSEDAKLLFAEEFLRTGSVRQAAKKAGISERTGHTLANELEASAEFAEARRRLHKHALDRAEAAVMRSIDILSERIESATELLGGADGEVKVIDKAADYGKSIASLNDSLLKRRKLEDDIANRQGPATTGPLEIVIRRAAKLEPEPSGDG
jgi:phage terminase small subunit